MKETLNTYEIADRLFRDENANWSYAGAKALAEYLDTDENENAEFDRVAIRCDFSEYATLVEWANDYFGGNSWREEMNIEEEDGDDDIDDEIRRYINDNGVLIEFDSGIIVSSF